MPSVIHSLNAINAPIGINQSIEGDRATIGETLFSIDLTKKQKPIPA